MSNILSVVVILLAVYVIVEMVLCLMGKIPPPYAAYTTEFAVSLMLVGVGMCNDVTLNGGFLFG